MTKIAGSGSISQRHGSLDLDPPQNVMDPEQCLRVYGSRMDVNNNYEKIFNAFLLAALGAWAAAKNRKRRRDNTGSERRVGRVWGYDLLHCVCSTGGGGGGRGIKPQFCRPAGGRYRSVIYCEGCVVVVVVRLPPPWFVLQVSRLPGKGGYSTRPPGPPVH